MKAAYIAVCALLLLLLAETNISVEAVTCNPMDLSPCQGAITSNSSPSELCCIRIKQQKPCLCQYLKNPGFSKFLNSSGAQKVSSMCQVAIPKC